jgi:glyoxylase-like metal-dependent hydrolase (beta-lactamase superfamily II)
MCRKKEGRQWLCHPAERLQSVGIDPARVEHVILSHLHWDHGGHAALFPKATFYLQEAEMAFWTGKYVRYQHFRTPMEVDHVVEMVRLNYDGRVRFVDGSAELFPGITVHRARGHTAGIQVTEVRLASGTAVVASDAVHTYRNLRDNRPTPIILDASGYLDGYELVRRLAREESYILPGHDAEVLRLHPQVAEDVVRLE